MARSRAFFLLPILSLLLPIKMPAAEKEHKGTAHPGPAADIVVLNGKVWTVDPEQPRAEAIAVLGERIAAVGTNAQIKQWIGPKTRSIDAHGKTVLPGFIDAHVHFSSGGAELSGVQLRQAATPAEFAQSIGEHARKLPRGEWILGGEWDHEMWGGTLPNREWIDTVTPDHPVLVSRYDGHMALANSLALRLAGVTRDTPTRRAGQSSRMQEVSRSGC